MTPTVAHGSAFVLIDQANGNPSQRPFVHMLRERYPDLSGAAAPG